MASVRVRVRLQFADRHLLSKDQRSKGLRRCWVLLRPQITTVAEFRHHIKRLFGLRCASVDHLFLSMDGFVLPSFESTCMFRDKDLITVETSIDNNKDKFSITDGSTAKEKDKIEKQTGLLIDNGENSNHQKKRPSKEKESKKLESFKKKLKRTPHEEQVVINMTNNNRFLTTATQNNGPINHVVLASDKDKQIMANYQTGPNTEGSNEKSQMKLPQKGNNWKNANVNADNNWEAGGNMNTNSAWEVGEASNRRETQQTESGWGTWPPSSSRAGVTRFSVVGQKGNFGAHGGFSYKGAGNLTILDLASDVVH